MHEVGARPLGEGDLQLTTDPRAGSESSFTNAPLRLMLVTNPSDFGRLLSRRVALRLVWSGDRAGCPSRAPEKLGQALAVDLVGVPELGPELAPGRFGHHRAPDHDSSGGRKIELHSDGQPGLRREDERTWTSSALTAVVVACTTSPCATYRTGMTNWTGFASGRRFRAIARYSSNLPPYRAV